MAEPDSSGLGAQDPSSSADTARDVAASVFAGISLLSIKRSVRLLLELESAVIEDFVKKYSAVMIFFLNILDQGRSGELLEKLTNSAVIYTVEEELRFLYIREIALPQTDPERIMGISALLERLDDPRPGTMPDQQEVRPLLAGMVAGADTRQRSHVAYLDALDATRRLQVLRQLWERNPHALLGLLPFASKDLLHGVVDLLCHVSPAALQTLPLAIHELYFRTGGSQILRPEVLGFLPPEMQERVQKLDEVHQRYQTRFAELADLAGQDEHQRHTESKDRPINVALEILRESDPATHNLVLDELLRRRSLSEREVYILREILKNPII